MQKLKMQINKFSNLPMRLMLRNKLLKRKMNKSNNSSWNSRLQDYKILFLILNWSHLSGFCFCWCFLFHLNMSLMSQSLTFRNKWLRSFNCHLAWWCKFIFLWKNPTFSLVVSISTFFSSFNKIYICISCGVYLQRKY